jgi:hypothetical protein
MFKNRYILRSVSQLVTQAAKQTLADLRDGWVEQEAPFTDRLVTNLQNQIDGKTVKGIRWKAKTLTDRGPQSQENLFGADFLGVLTLDLQELSVTKGFLAQAKLIHRRRKANNTEFNRLKDQCHKMLKVTPDAFVFLYSRRGIKIVPASTIVGTSSSNLRSLADRTIGRFFTEYVECFIGDPKLEAPSLEKFRAIADRYQVRQGLYLYASDKGDVLEKKPGYLSEKQSIRAPVIKPTSTVTHKEDKGERQRIRQKGISHRPLYN